MASEVWQMGDAMRQLPFGQLMTWALGEYERNGSVFEVGKLYDHGPDSRYGIFGMKPELPFGPAAGPHTQLAQNLVASYVAGARFFELKTVQVLDGEDLPVSKPCIYAGDEGYNVEWSTELYVPQALDEYIKGWLAIKLLSRELGLGSDDGFVFNMSVGYDLEGIKTLKIDSFIEGLKNAEETDSWKACIQWAYDNLTRFKYVDKYMLDSLVPQISNSITLSTLHGCPPEEIERIAAYLLRDKRLHTFIKCNPTLLGYSYARNTLDKLGYEYISFDDTHFKNDLQFDDAVPMLSRLQELANSLSLEFGVKLTNTFPVQIRNNELPGGEMYMSGRALFPLSIEVANRLSKAFDGKLKISYSGGADMRNIIDIYDTGIWPITLATTLLKPGGYERLHQIATLLREAEPPKTQIDPERLHKLAGSVASEAMYKKPVGMTPERKISGKLPLLDCFTAPCSLGCPLNQDVPAYLRLMDEGKHLEALRVVTERNPLPHITGTICAHNCMSKCARFYYEESVDIRAVKLAAAQSAFKPLLAEIGKTQRLPKKGMRAAIVGGGPAGLAAAYFLAKAGCMATIIEEKASLGGVVRHVIPEFRIPGRAIDNDIALCTAMGAEVRLNTRVADIDTLRSEGFEHIIIATGAWQPGMLELEEGSAVDALAFLENLKSNPSGSKLGENIVVIGGGNTAMDTARAAMRENGVKKVSIVYRRTKRYMPAASEEIELAMEDGIEFMELAAPLGLKDGMLACALMKLGEPDSSGRRSPVPTGETTVIPCDLLISAIGNKVDGDLFKGQDVYVIGDAARGPSTVAEAIADALHCAADITGERFERYAGLNVNPDETGVRSKRGVLYKDAGEVRETKRCLECATICDACVEVCPNRANINVEINGRPQIVHMDFMCNECGNCAVFCPYDGAPYLDKFTYFMYVQDFEDSENAGFLTLEDGTIRIRLDGGVSEHRDGTKLPKDIWALIEETIRTVIERS